MAKKRWSPSARTSDQAKAALADLAVVALERLSDPEVQAQIAAQGRAIADQAIAWRAERRRRARLDDDGDAASPAGSSRSGWLSESFGQGKLDELYEMDNPKVAFPLWLKSMHDPDFLGRALKGHRLPSSGLMGFMGFYTYRFMRVTMPYPEIFLRKPFIRSMDGAVAAQRKWAMYDVLMRSETLDQEFAEFAARRGPELGFSANAVDVVNKQAEKHKNMSKRTLESYRDYYTDELRELVATRDRFFIDLFGYRF